MQRGLRGTGPALPSAAGPGGGQRPGTRERDLGSGYRPAPGHCPVPGQWGGLCAWHSWVEPPAAGADSRAWAGGQRRTQRQDQHQVPTLPLSSPWGPEEAAALCLLFPLTVGGWPGRPAGLNRAAAERPGPAAARGAGFWEATGQESGPRTLPELWVKLKGSAEPLWSRAASWPSWCFSCTTGSLCLLQGQTLQVAWGQSREAKLWDLVEAGAVVKVCDKQLLTVISKTLGRPATILPSFFYPCL